MDLVNKLLIAITCKKKLDSQCSKHVTEEDQTNLLPQVTKPNINVQQPDENVSRVIYHFLKTMVLKRPVPVLQTIVIQEKLHQLPRPVPSRGKEVIARRTLTIKKRVETREYHRIF